MASRFGRDSRNTLFSGYDATQARTKSQSPYRPNGYSYSAPQNGSPGSRSTSNPSVGAYPTGGGSTMRTATPNKRGQYSDAVLNELESQNEEQLEGMSAKVRMLKDVSILGIASSAAACLFVRTQITSAIGEEIRDSTAFAEKMNDSFEGTRNRLRGTMNRMLRMAEKTGVGWRVWLGFFTFVILLFLYVKWS
ncbi:MAG: protein transport protein bet1 [Chrysothrix sp. TS-e1954]|nr:MAG: protein transport protein bet1 [Chrysothrix sp. TS-e1954]